MIRTLRMICVGSCLSFAAMLVLVALPGCNKGPEPPKDGKNPKTHADEVGPHGGPVAHWGKEKYHAEFIVDSAKKQVTIYILGEDPDKDVTIDPKKITDVNLTIVGSNPEVKLDLQHDAKESGKKGIAFTGTHDLFAKPDDMKVYVGGKVDGEIYGDSVTYKAPKKSSSSLYLTPGGIYTAADVKANGNTTPDEKYKGKIFSHRKDLKPGDKICPVTDKKANAECAWIVQGQRYEFCCQPCLNDFIDWAHHDTKQIKDADKYVHKGM